MNFNEEKMAIEKAKLMKEVEEIKKREEKLEELLTDKLEEEIKKM